jgi:DNA-binding response OmpR family regulator
MTSSMQILLADDEKDLAWAICHSLSNEGYQVRTAHDGVEALKMAVEHRPDLVLLDIIMPRLDGLQVCRELRRSSDLAQVPILFMTERTAIKDRVLGLDQGADDYLSKPFDLRELKARVRALLRRTLPLDADSDAQAEPEHTLSVDDFSLDIKACHVTVLEQEIELTPSQCELLQFLLNHPRQIFGSADLLHRALGYPKMGGDSSLVRWHIKNLREKIEPCSKHPVYLRTVHRQGYILDPHNVSSRFESNCGCACPNNSGD